MSEQHEHAGQQPRGPHQAIPAADERERFTLRLFDALWETYRGRVSPVGVYENVIRGAGGTFVNDHIAFRTIASQRPAAGIMSIARVAEALGYRSAGLYDFEDQHLNAVHYQHPNPLFPKLFISEIKVWELSGRAREIIRRALAHHRPLPDEETLAAVVALKDQGAGAPAELLGTLLDHFQSLPWEPPERGDVEELNRESQYASWVLVHGHNVNHFTALINSHGAGELDDIEKTIAALKGAGVPMKARIEGERGTRLRQSATEAVVIDAPMREEGRVVPAPWTYAYFELAERGEIVDPETGRRVRFEGFLGPQASQLFEMTRRRPT